MPIDEAMIHELADDWFPPFLDERPCPSVLYDCCEECSARNWDEDEGGVVTWDEGGGTAAYFAEVDER